MTKYYVIFSKEDEVVFPIRAVLSPYEDRFTRKTVPAPCGGMPQFFGGRAKQNEAPLAFLKQEVQRQSIKTFRLEGSANDLKEVQTAIVNSERCVFYRTEQWTKNPSDEWPTEEFWKLLEPEYREMVWVAKVPKIKFEEGATPIGDTATKLDVLKILTNVAAQDAPVWVKNQLKGTSVKQFADFATSETFTAFYKFLDCWSLS